MLLQFLCKKINFYRNKKDKIPIFCIRIMSTPANSFKILSFQHLTMRFQCTLKYESLRSNNLKLYYRTNCEVSKLFALS